MDQRVQTPYAPSDEDLATQIIPTGSTPVPVLFPGPKDATNPKAVFDRECKYLEDLFDVGETLKAGLPSIPFGSQGYNFTLKSWHMIQIDTQKQQDRVKQASANLLQYIQEQQHQDRWQKQYELLLKQLFQAYGDMGPQYHILIKRLAFAEVKAQQMEEAGRVESNEWRKMVQEVREIVSALQKYTESEKKEVVNPEIQAAVMSVLEIVENELQNRYPQIWQRIMHRIEARVEGREED